MPARDDRVETGVELDLAAIGIPPPPARLKGALVATARSARLRVEAPPADARAVAEWLVEVAGTVRVEEEPHILSCGLTRLAPAWRKLLLRLDVDEASAGADGILRLLVRGARADVRALVQRTGGRPRIGRLVAAAAASPLTDRQRRILELAVREGYYDIPRRTTLAALARRCGSTAPAVSELLRRAEARLVREVVGADTRPRKRRRPS